MTISMTQNIIQSLYNLYSSTWIKLDPFCRHWSCSLRQVTPQAKWNKLDLGSTRHIVFIADDSSKTGNSDIVVSLCHLFGVELLKSSQIEKLPTYKNKNSIG